MAFEALVDAIPAVPGLLGRPRKRPYKLHADKGHNFCRCREHLKRRGILARIARRGVEGSEKLGRHRWIVERTHAWLAGFGKLRIRFERRLDTHYALLKLACSLIVLSTGFVNGSKWEQVPCVSGNSSTWVARLDFCNKAYLWLKCLVCPAPRGQRVKH